MKGSLQEQLLKSGLINKERLNKPKKKPAKKKHQPNANKYHRQHTTPPDSVTPAELKKQKELRADVKKLLRSHKINDNTGEIAYNYTINNQIKRFFVTEAQQKSLIEGEVAIVNWNGISYLIPKEAAEEAKQLFPKINVCLVEKQETKETNANDPYADFVIPDDIKW